MAMYYTALLFYLSNTFKNHDTEIEESRRLDLM